MKKDVKKTALIVDGGADFRELFAELLKFREFEVTCVGDGEKAVEQIKQQPYYVVLMDVHVSGIKGLEFMKKMKVLRPNQKIIILSDDPDPSYTVERKAFQEGASECLLKPIEVSELDRIIRETMGGKR